jgi:hypothetical protein
MDRRQSQLVEIRSPKLTILIQKRARVDESYRDSFFGQRKCNPIGVIKK